MSVEIKDVVCDHGIYIDGELALILNSRTNAEIIKQIIEVDSGVPNAAVPVTRGMANVIENLLFDAEYYRMMGYSLEERASVLAKNGNLVFRRKTEQ